MASVEVYHAVLGVGPYNREVTKIYHIFDAQGVILWGKGE